jgi:threonine dehydratase
MGFPADAYCGPAADAFCRGRRSLAQNIVARSFGNFTLPRIKEPVEIIHPYDDDRIIAGQGAAALKILADRSDIDTLVVPVGGGGFIAGCAIAAKDINPAIEIIGVETEMYPSMPNALFGETDRRTGGYSIADGISVKSPGERTLKIVKEHVSRIDMVREDDIESAIHMLAEIEK